MAGGRSIEWRRWRPRVILCDSGPARDHEGTVAQPLVGRLTVSFETLMLTGKFPAW